MTTKYGMFKDYDYKLQGRPASEGSAVPSKPVFDPTGGGDRDKGISLKATVGRTGKNNDATFSKFQSLHQGDKYVDPRRRDLQAEVEKRKANITDIPFKAVAPMKKSVGAGDYYGTLEGKVVHEPDTVHVPKKKGDIPEQPKGIYTNPAKKGSYGMNKYTISEKQGFKGVSTEYEYQHDPLDVHKKIRMDALDAHHKACVTELPFKPSNPAKKGTYGVPNTTISKGKGIAGEWEYIMAAPAPSVAEGSAEGGEAAGKKEEKEELLPFRPSNAHVANRINHINYIHDPEAPKLKSNHEKKIEESKRIAATGAWKPNMSYKSDMVRSVVRMNIPR